MGSPDYQTKGTEHRRALQQKADLERLNLTTIQNANLPIHTLPAEVLLQIFQHFLPSYRSFPANSKTTDKSICPWARLMGVCRHWRALIKNDAYFWRDIEVRSKYVQWLSLALRRSGDAPVRVTLFRNLKTALPLLMEHPDNIEALSFEGSIHDPGVASILSWPSSILHSLEVSLEKSYHPTRSTLPLFNCGSPRLVKLALTRVSLPWSASILADLEVLSLTHCQLSTPPLPFEDFLDVLERGQKLRNLCLKHFLSAALSPKTSSPASWHGRCITLPSLHRLACHDAPARVAQLLAHIHTPAIVEIELEGKWDTLDAPSIAGATLSSLLPADLARVPALQSISSAALEVGHEGRKLHGSSSSHIDLRFFLHKPPASWARELEEEVRRLPIVFGAALTKLELSGDLDFSPGTWDAVFEAFPGLQTLSLHHVRSGDLLALPAGLFGSLQSGSAATGEAHVGAHCPALKELTLYPVWWKLQTVDAVLECLRFRVAKGARRLERLSLGAESRLPESVDIEDERNREQFREFIDEIVLWYW
ncbi:hypothetical protein TRAPUB_11564 [Trametes pubescens]|uniref:F-box domain-containing protein n=1 Tax=Trametes pubescens TaxID=154538 RepID=A0A1M2VWG7_TRAPU|nr:hypothetical protein TRAPUB_11564 [Trametes pubescens]